MAEFTRNDLLTFGRDCHDYFVVWDDDNNVMHFLARVADVEHTFTTDLHEALQFDDDNTAFMFVNLVNALYPSLECYIVELTYGFSFYRPNAVDCSNFRRNTTRSAD